jgi:hypothetical protein
MHLRATFFLLMASCLSLCGVVLNQDDIDSGKLGRPVGNMERLLAQLQAQKVPGVYSLVVITNVFKNDPLPVMHDGETLDMSKYYYSTGNIAVLNPENTQLTVRQVPYTVYLSYSRNYTRESYNIFSPYMTGNLTSTFAVCKLPANSSKPLAEFPETYVIPDSWVKDMGELLASPNLGDYTKRYATNLDLTAKSATVPKLALFIYGANLAKTNPQEFAKEFPDLISMGDIYTGAYFSYLLITGAQPEKIDPTAVLGANIKDLTKPEALAAISLGIENYCDTHPMHSPAAAAIGARLRLLIELIHSKIQPNDSKWDQVTQITNSVLHRFYS